MKSSLPKHKYLQFTDEALTKLAQSGDEAAASVILDRYRSFVKAISSNYFSASLEPDDIAQEGMLAVLSAVYSFSQERNAVFRSFAAVCVNNRHSVGHADNLGLNCKVTVYTAAHRSECLNGDGGLVALGGRNGDCAGGG